MVNAALALLRRIGHRGSALLFFFFLDVIYAFSLFSPDPTESANNPVLRYLVSVGPLWIFGVMWLIAAMFCLYNAFRVRDWAGFAAAIAIKVLWGLLFVGAWVEGLPRAYVSVTLWLVLAGFVAIISHWPEPTQMPSQQQSSRCERLRKLRRPEPPPAPDSRGPDLSGGG